MSTAHRTPGTLVGVGVGPGDPDHLTLGALRALQAADRVFVPETDSGEVPGRAERLVAPHVAPDRIERLRFAMRDDHARPDNWDRAGRAIAAVCATGATAAFATIGDPNLYSTFTYIAQTVDAIVPGLTVRTIPGITAMQDLAARSGTVLAQGDERLVLVPMTAGDEALHEALAGSGTVVIYKGGRHLERIHDALGGAGRLDAAVYGEQLGLEDERIGAVAEHVRGPYMSTVLSPPERLAGRGAALAGSRRREPGT
jgi:precorrin-2/cobalt-factor-2 C20-methyltransferase